MAISPIVLNGTISNVQNVLSHQTQQAQKGLVDQGHIYMQEEKQEQQKARQVVHSENSQLKEERFDAKEKGHGGYQGDGGRNRKKKEADGKVVKKPAGRFDIKV